MRRHPFIVASQRGVIERQKYGMLTSWRHRGYYFEISDANRFQKHLLHSVKMRNEYCIINISEGDVFLLLDRNVTEKHGRMSKKIEPKWRNEYRKRKFAFL